MNSLTDNVNQLTARLSDRIVTRFLEFGVDPGTILNELQNPAGELGYFIQEANRLGLPDGALVHMVEARCGLSKET